MKKTYLFALSALALTACGPKTETTTVNTTENTVVMESEAPAMDNMAMDNGETMDANDAMMMSSDNGTRGNGNDK